MSLVEKEYESLRQEIIEWQTRRLAVASGSLVIVIAVLGWAVSAPGNWSWDIISSLLLTVLTIGCYVVWLTCLFTSRISTYIEVFHEGEATGIGWERRHRIPRKRFDSSRGAFAAVYLGTGVFSVLISILVCNGHSEVLGRILFSLTLVSFAISISLLFFQSSHWNRYINRWQEIKKQETAGDVSMNVRTKGA